MPTDSASAVVFDIQRGALNDGPGLRTVVFVKGCPLRCRWCHNPEAFRHEPQTVTTERGETKTYGKVMTAEEVFGIVERDQEYYHRSGGGVTISGGEPMASFPFTLELARRCREAGIQVALDSTGWGSADKWQILLPFVDLVLFDVKDSDPERHLAHTGAHLAPLLDTLTLICDHGTPVLLRCPIIPGMNDKPEHFAALLRIQETHPNVTGIELLPYHSTGVYKYRELGLDCELETLSTPPPETVAEWRTFLNPPLESFQG